MRINFEVNDAQMAQINGLKRKVGASSMKELFDNALSILDWAADETAEGREIAAVAADDKSYRVFVTPLLRRVAAKEPAAS